MSTVEYYFIGVNVIGFLLHWLITKLRAGKGSAGLNIFWSILSLLGGAGGIFLSIILFDRKAVKENMMSRVLILCAFVIEIVALLFVYGPHKEALTFAFLTFLSEHKLLLVYLGIMNAITFIAFAMDKVKAIKNKRRIRIVTLLALAFLGGSIGGLLGMYLLRHKTQKDYFTVGIPLMLLTQVVVLFYAMNAAW